MIRQAPPGHAADPATAYGQAAREIDLNRQFVAQQLGLTALQLMPEGAAWPARNQVAPLVTG